MSDVEKHIEFVNRQTAYHAKQADRLAALDNPHKSARHAAISSQYKDLSDFLTANASRLNGAVSGDVKRLGLSWDEVRDLPPELVAELSVSDGDKLEFDIIQIVQDCGGVASLDRILLELYKRTEEITKRTWLNNRLYRMVQKEALFSVPSKKGVYSLFPVNEEIAQTLL